MQNEQIHVYKYRWIILFIFNLVSIQNFSQLLQFSIITDTISKFYNVQSYWVDATSLIFFLVYILFFYPICYFVDRYSLKISVGVAICLTVTGNLLKLLASTPSRFWLILLAQFPVAIAQVQLSSLPTKLATTWFGSEEVSTACAVVVFGMQLGTALGCIQSSYVVSSDSDTEIKSQLLKMFIYQASIGGAILLLVIVCFRTKPILPPSQSQLNLNERIDGNFLTTMKLALKNKDFWFISLSLGTANGIWNSFGVIFNSVYIIYFPDNERDAGVIALLAIVAGGCIGSMVFGFILDKTHKFKVVGLVVLSMSALLTIAVGLSLILESRVAAFIIIPIFGFFIAPVLIIGFEYLVEVTYPLPEVYGASAFNAAYFTLAILATLIFEGVLIFFGYAWTVGVTVVLLVGSVVVLSFTSNDLKRRAANLENKNLQIQ
ncbi:hypothetical protein ABEB36_006331 [Hypothenemus hampei]|uniref:Major facilitator superfamily (MFS) profile domain-containing protein n=1 Tax=Hypothenemus hampei TaxID=57062 RepID=A0ABD1EQ75_HYPHA